MKPTHLHWRSTWPAVVALGVSALALALGACSLRYDFTECDTAADCAQLQTPGDGRAYQCIQHECILEAGAQCQTNTECADDRQCVAGECQAITPPTDTGDTVDTGDTGDTGEDTTPPDVSPSGCSSTQQCIDESGDSFYCAPSGECVDTALSECDDIYYPDSERGDIIVLGSIIPTQGDAFEAIGKTIDNAIRMAVTEFASTVFTLPGGQTVAYLHCQGGNSAVAMSAAEHMQAIGVPFIVGPLTSSIFIDVVRDVIEVDQDNDGSADTPVGAIAMGATAPAIGNLESAGTHAFQIISDDRFQTSAMVDRIKGLRSRSCDDGDEPSAQCTDDASCQAAFGPDYVFQDTQRPCRDSDPKVAVFYKDDQYGRGFQSLLINRFGSRYEDATVEYYKYPNPADLDFNETRIAAKFAEKIEASTSGPDGLPDADIVAFVGTGEATRLAKGYIGALVQRANDQGLSNSLEFALSRRYIFSHGAAADAPDMFAGDDGLADDLLSQVEAVSPNIFNEPLYSLWQNRYANTFDEPAQSSAGAIAYDAAYLAIFAMAGVPPADTVTGENATDILAGGRLQNNGVEATKLDNDATSLGQAEEALGDGQAIDLEGVSGSLDFVIDEGKNQGTVRSKYVGFDVAVTGHDSSGKPIYEVVPERAYIIPPNGVFGFWAQIPDD